MNFLKFARRISALARMVVAHVNDGGKIKYYVTEFTFFKENSMNNVQGRLYADHD